MKNVPLKFTAHRDKELINILNSLKEQKEVIELELQHSDISLNAGGGISVKIPPII